MTLMLRYIEEPMECLILQASMGSFLIVRIVSHCVGVRPRHNSDGTEEL